jgi:hypothetical protein
MEAKEENRVIKHHTHTEDKGSIVVCNDDGGKGGHSALS